MHYRQREGLGPVDKVFVLRDGVGGEPLGVVIYGYPPLSLHLRNRVTGGGVTAGLDFGLVILAALLGEDIAKVTQLAMEYDPAPPFDAGTPKKAGPAVVKKVQDWIGPVLGEKLAATCAAAAKATTNARTASRSFTAWSLERRRVGFAGPPCREGRSQTAAGVPSCA